MNYWKEKLNLFIIQFIFIDLCVGYSILFFSKPLTWKLPEIRGKKEKKYGFVPSFTDLRKRKIVTFIQTSDWKQIDYFKVDKFL